MSFLGVLMDRARKIERRKGMQNPELGESEFYQQFGDWYKVRLLPPDHTEARSDNAGARNIANSSIMTGPEFDLSHEDRVEIDSKELGTGVWTVVGEPTLIRKKRTLMGKQYRVQQVEIT